MPFVVVYDACVLYPNTLRDLLIRIAVSGLVQARWTDRILDELETALRKRRPDTTAEQTERLRRLMVRAVPDCLVTGYEGLADGLDLPDENDRHVVAAAKQAGAQVIVTHNLRDFPADQLRRLGLEAKSPDEFVLDQLGIDDREVWACLQQIADSRRKPPETIDDIMNQLERAGLIRSVAQLRSPGSSPSG